MSARLLTLYPASLLQRKRACRTSSLARHFHPQIALKLVILTMALLLVASSAVMASDSEDGPQSSGTGFAVSRQGHILTNYHVVDNCPSIRVTTTNGEQKELTVVASDKKNDLAIVKLSGTLSSVARFRKGRDIRSGDSIVVVGFPFNSFLASEAHVTTGTVSALAGLGNDTRFLQITAPVQPGNSGGPVLDKSGNIVGIVESKLNALAMALITGDIPQNVNFAIKHDIAKLFLGSHGVMYETAVSEKQLEPADIGEAAKQFTFLLACYSQKIDAKHRVLLEAERRALEAERRVLDEERQALAEARRRDQEARARALRLEEEERARITRENVQQHEEAKRQAAEQKREREQAEKEPLLEAEAASERVLRFHAEERAREAKEEAERQALNAEPQILEEARRKGQEARARALLKQEEPARIPKEEAQQAATLPTVNSPAATLKGFRSGLSNSYWARVEAIITSHWEAPPIANKGQSYSATVKFRLFRDGTVKDVEIQQTSGNSYFDMSAQRAVLRHRVLPPFPAEMTEEYQDIAMVFRAGELVR